MRLMVEQVLRRSSLPCSSSISSSSSYASSSSADAGAGGPREGRSAVVSQGCAGSGTVVLGAPRSAFERAEW